MLDKNDYSEIFKPQVDEIDIDALREYQRKEYELQRDDETYKPTPPNFKPPITEHKQSGTLWDYINGSSNL